jgi:hypothetical protein
MDKKQWFWVLILVHIALITAEIFLWSQGGE